MVQRITICPTDGNNPLSNICARRTSLSSLSYIHFPLVTSKQDSMYRPSSVCYTQLNQVVEGIHLVMTQIPTTDACQMYRAAAIRKEDVVTVSSHTLVHINIHDSNHTLSSNCFSITYMHISPLSLHSMHTPSYPQWGGVERGFFCCLWSASTSLRQCHKLQ